MSQSPEHPDFPIHDASPEGRAKGSAETVEVALAIVLRGRAEEAEILISQRRADQVLGGLWEIPGGKIEPNETASQAAEREVAEEVGVEIRALEVHEAIEHTYEHARVRLIPVRCEWIAGSPEPLQVAECRWVRLSDLICYRFPEANQPLILAIIHGQLA